MKLILLTMSIFAIYFGVNLSSPADLHFVTSPQKEAFSLSPAEAPIVNVSVSNLNFARTIKHNEGICINNRTHAEYTNVLVSEEEVAFYASKFWTGHDLKIAIALTIPEGQRDLNCYGDDVKPYYGAPTNDGRHYGESIGLWQYRTIIEATGLGGCEDITWQQGNIERQAECAFQKFDVNDNFNPWTAYKKGTYKSYL